MADKIAVPGGKSDPPDSDLDYYSRPENYAGNSLQTMQRFVLTKKVAKTSDDDDKNKVRPDHKFLYQRYRYVFPKDDELEEIIKEHQKNNTKVPEDKTIRIEFKDDSKDQTLDKEKKEDRDSSKLSDTPHHDGRSSTLTPIPDSESLSPLPRVVSSKFQNECRASSTLSPDSDASIPGSACLTPVRGSTSGGSQVGGSAGRKSVRSSMMSRSRNTLSKDVKAKLARERFRHACRMVLIIRKWVSALIKKDQDSQDPKMTTFTDLVKEYSYENLKNSGLHFDPAYFKAKKEISLSSEVKYILSLPSSFRTPEQIQTAMYGLQSLRSFAEYPLHMQEKLCKVAWFETVSPKRMIIRQGHLAENFYFILSGQAVVTILVRDPRTGESSVRTATIMRKGMSFGELALLHHSRRTATVTTQDNVQLLSIGRDDFFDIFMSGSGPDQIPDHIRFVGQLEFMKDWPLEKLLEHPEHCLLHFFKRNVVIVKDSLVNEWLYIVKSGSCQVIKTLKGVTPQLGIRKKSEIEERYRLPKLGTGEQGARIDTGMRKGKPAPVPEMVARAITQFEVILKKNKLFGVKQQGKSEESKGSEEKEDGEEETTEPATVEPKTDPGFSKSKYARFSSVGDSKFVQGMERAKTLFQERKAYTPSKKNWMKLKIPKIVPIVATKPPPVFVQVEALKPRDVFGLTSIQFDDDIVLPHTTVSLVSRGAECIMLNKGFFVKHANEAVKQMIRRHIRPYPAEDTFQENLQIKEDWNLYKTTLIDDITNLHVQKKSLSVLQV